MYNRHQGTYTKERLVLRIGVECVCFPCFSNFAKWPHSLARGFPSL